MMRPLLLIALATGLIAASLSCSGGDDEGEPTPTSTRATGSPTATREAGAVSVEKPANWTYWLSDIDLDAIGGASPEAVVIDYSRDGGADSEFSRADIDSLHASMSGPRLVISYMSIGEAEDYRYYWQESWSSSRPSWLEKENPSWLGNYKVRYWDPEWQSLIFGSPDSYLDKIIAAGFDGVYLDIIDAYDYFTEQGRETAEDEMVAFVTAISEYAKSKRPGFLVFPQNAPELGARADYLAVVDGIGMEGVYFGWDEPDRATSAADTEWLEEQLARFVSAGKTVLAVDYAKADSDVAEAYSRSRAQGFVPTVTDVDLGQLPYPER
jgi:cysteinyl-tRNA synthetase